MPDTPVPAPPANPAPTPPSEPVASSPMPLARVYELGKDAITLAVLPIAMWTMNISIENALQSERIQNLQDNIQVMKAEHVKVEKLREDLQGLEVLQARMEGKVDTANARLDQIKVLLNDQ